MSSKVDALKKLYTELGGEGATPRTVAGVIEKVADTAGDVVESIPSGPYVITMTRDGSTYTVDKTFSDIVAQYAEDPFSIRLILADDYAPQLYNLDSVEFDEMDTSKLLYFKFSSIQSDAGAPTVAKLYTVRIAENGVTAASKTLTVS